MQNITTEHCHCLQSPQFQEEKVRCSFTLATSFAEKFFCTPRNSLCPLQRAVLRTVSTMLSALAGGWGRSAPPAPKLDPGGSCPTACLGSSHGAPSRRSRAGPLPTACPTTCGAQAAEAQVEGGRRPESADTEQAHAHPGSPPPTPGRTPLSPRISGVFAPFGRQQCHSGCALSPGVRHALAPWHRSTTRGPVGRRRTPRGQGAGGPKPALPGQRCTLATAGGRRAPLAHSDPRPLDQFGPLRQVASARACEGMIPPSVKPSAAAVAFLTASSWAQRQAQTQPAAQSDLHHFGWERGGRVRRHRCKPGSRLLAGLGKQQGTVGWFQGRQQHAFAEVVGASTRRMKLPTMWPCSHRAQLPLQSRAQARCQWGSPSSNRSV